MLRSYRPITTNGLQKLCCDIQLSANQMFYKNIENKLKKVVRSQNIMVIIL